MKLSMPFFGSSSSSSSSGGKKQQETTTISKKKRKGSKTGGGGGSSFGSTASSSSSSSSSDECASPSAVTTPRTVLPVRPASSSSPAGGGNGKPVRKPLPPVAAVVTREDLEAALRRVVGASEAELAAVLAEAEAAGLAPEAAAAAEAQDEAELRGAFAVFDADGDGRISAEELRAVLASLGDECCSVDDCRRMIRGVDGDGDGFVCFAEFSRMMMTTPQGASA